MRGGTEDTFFFNKYRRIDPNKEETSLRYYRQGVACLIQVSEGVFGQTTAGGAIKRALVRAFCDRGLMTRMTQRSVKVVTVSSELNVGSCDAKDTRDHRFHL